MTRFINHKSRTAGLLSVSLVLVFAALLVSTALGSWTSSETKLFRANKPGFLKIRDDRGKLVVGLWVPKGALLEDEEITAEVTYDSDAGVILFDFSPDLTFEKPVQIYVSKIFLIREGFDPDDIVLYRINEETGESEVETTGEKGRFGVKLEVTHFSRYYFGRR